MTIQTLTLEESARLLAVLQAPCNTTKARMLAHRNHLLALLMLDAGLRVSEVSRLTIEDLVFDDCPRSFLIVRPEIAKRAKSRQIPLSGRIVESIQQMLISVWLPAYARPHWYAFWGRSPEWAITPRQVQRIIGAASKRILGRSVHPHCLRHTFGTRLMKTVSIRIVQELLGHSNLSSTQIYMHPDNADLRGAIDSLDTSKLEEPMYSKSHPLHPGNLKRA